MRSSIFDFWTARSIVSGGAVLGDQVFLEPFTLVPEDFTVPAGEHWGGSPAIKLSQWSEDAHTPAPTPLSPNDVANSTVVDIGPHRLSDVVPAGVVYVSPSATQRPLFPCWITCWQIGITLLGTLLSIAIYLPSLAMVRWKLNNWNVVNCVTILDCNFIVKIEKLKCSKMCTILDCNYR